MKTYKINLNDLEHGGGWQLVLIEDNIEVSADIFPAGVNGYCRAHDEGEAWAPTV